MRPIIILTPWLVTATALFQRGQHAGRDAWSWSGRCSLVVTIGDGMVDCNASGDCSTITQDVYAQVEIGSLTVTTSQTKTTTFGTTGTTGTIKSTAYSWNEELNLGCQDESLPLILSVYNEPPLSLDADAAGGGGDDGTLLAGCMVDGWSDLENGIFHTCSSGDALLTFMVTYSVAPPERGMAGGERLKMSALEGTERSLQARATPAPSTPETVTPAPVVTPTPSPVAADTPAPVVPPSPAPVVAPTDAPVAASTKAPVVPITDAPVAPATDAPVVAPTPAPVTTPTPVVAATPAPVVAPTTAPVAAPTKAPVDVVEPTAAPVVSSTKSPVVLATPAPVTAPTAAPVVAPTRAPVTAPTAAPLPAPTKAPVVESTTGTDAPVALPTSAPVVVPPPTSAPVLVPPPTSSPVPSPTSAPVVPPTAAPVKAPVLSPSAQPVTPTDTPSFDSGPVAGATPAPVTDPTLMPLLVSTPSPSNAVLATTPPSTSANPPTLEPTALRTPSPSSSSGAGGQLTDKPVTVPPTLGVTIAPTIDPSGCTDACSLNFPQDNKFLGAYYDALCDGSDSLPGCNLSSDEELLNCRTCFINKDEFGDTSLEYPECPCCVAEVNGFEPQTEECDVTTTPAPTASFDTISASEHTPELSMFTFDAANCTMNGFNIYPIDSDLSRLFDLEFYRDNSDGCSYEYATLFGRDCDADDITYSWSFGTSSFMYGWDGTCTEIDTSRRRLASVSQTYNIDSADILCNDGNTFSALVNTTSGQQAVVYATPTADSFASKTGSLERVTDSEYCDMDVGTLTSTVLEAGSIATAPEEDSEGGINSVLYIAGGGVLFAVVVAVLFCCHQYKNSKNGDLDHMRRNLGYTADNKGQAGNFGPTNSHVVVQRGRGSTKPTAQKLASGSFQPTYALRNSAPSEAPSSLIEDNIANNYQPKAAAKMRETKKGKNQTQGGSPGVMRSEELKAEARLPMTQDRLSEHSLNQLDYARNAVQGQAHPSAAQAQYGYGFEDDDDDAQSAATGMSGPSKYAPSGYAPSVHRGVTHDLMSTYEPSVYEAESTYDPSLYGRESDYTVDHHDYGFGGGVAPRGSITPSVADTAAGSRLGSVVEDNLDGRGGYAPSESYVSSYLSSTDEDDHGHRGGGMPGRVGGAHPSAIDMNDTQSPAYTQSRHSAYRSGRGGGHTSGMGGRSPPSGYSQERDMEEYSDSQYMDGPDHRGDDLDFFSDDGSSRPGGMSSRGDSAALSGGGHLMGVDENAEVVMSKNTRW